MTANPLAVPAHALVRDAVRILQELDFRHLPVVNEEYELIGILSDRDLRGFMSPNVVNQQWLGTVQSALDAQVSTVMNSDPLSVDLDADAAEIVDLILDHKIGAVPVVDADNKLVGIVSYVDVLRQLPLTDAEDRPLSTQMERQRARAHP
jgi:acetoin utilization protein AcuB